MEAHDEERDDVAVSIRRRRRAFRHGLLQSLAVMEHLEAIDRAQAQLFQRRTFRYDGRTMTIALLVRDADMRPLDAPWWRGKQVSIIGVDLDGNFFLRHSGGAVLYWDHRLQTATVSAPSVREFVERIE